jgi:hypothetical protein
VKKYLIVLFLFTLLAGCRYFKKTIPTGQVVARVYDKYLYTSDLKDVVAAGTTSQDSIEIVKNYINNWVRQELLVHHAENNLSSDQQDFTDEIEAYRKSLVIYRFETEYIKQKFDTVIPEKEIVAFYNENKENFRLHENICKAVWGQFPKTTSNANLAKIRQLFKKDKGQKLEQICATLAVNADVSDTAWIFFNDLVKKVPIKTDNPDEYLKKNNFAEIKSDRYIYFIRFTDVQNRESVSPLSFERDNIRTLILNKRRVGVLDKLEVDLFNKAFKNRDFQIMTPLKAKNNK